MGLPTYGTDATGEDTYAAVVAAPSGLDSYNYIVAWCSTKSAIVSLDAGTTGHIYLLCDKDPQTFHFSPIKSAIHAKNATAGQNYANIYIIAGYMP